MTTTPHTADHAAAPLTFRLRNGTEVLATMRCGELRPITYANRTAADKNRQAMGDGWAVFHTDRPFYVGRVRQ